MANSTVCAEKQHLVGAFEADTKAFAAAVTSLRDRIGTSAKGDYARLREAVDEARLESERSRLALERHIETHQC